MCVHIRVNAQLTLSVERLHSRLCSAVILHWACATAAALCPSTCPLIPQFLPALVDSRARIETLIPAGRGLSLHSRQHLHAALNWAALLPPPPPVSPRSSVHGLASPQPLLPCGLIILPFQSIQSQCTFSPVNSNTITLILLARKTYFLHKLFLCCSY